MEMESDAQNPPLVKGGVTLKHLPNVITGVRIFLSLLFPFIHPLGTLFIVIYLLCGLSDVTDGWLARSIGATSRLGEKLDSVADLLLVIVPSVVLFPILDPTGPILIWILVIALIRASALLVVFVKYHTFQILHTYLNNNTGVVIFLIPLSVIWLRGEVVIVISCAIATVSGIEELCINIVSDELDANRKTTFHLSV